MYLWAVPVVMVLICLFRWGRTFLIRKKRLTTFASLGSRLNHSESMRLMYTSYVGISTWSVLFGLWDTRVLLWSKICTLWTTTHSVILNNISNLVQTHMKGWWVNLGVPSFIMVSTIVTPYSLTDDLEKYKGCLNLFLVTWHPIFFLWVSTFYLFNSC